MKNMKVRAKLLAGFLAVTIFTLIVGAVGVISLSTLNSDYTEAVDMHGKPLENGGHALADLHAVRAEIRAAMLFTGNVERVRAQAELVQGFLDDFEARAAAYDKTIVTGDSRTLFDAAMDTYNNAFLPAVTQLLSDAENGVEQPELLAYMTNTIKPAVDLVINNFGQCMTNKGTNLDTASANGAALANLIFTVLLALIVAVSAISVVLGLYISGLISKPLAPLTAFMKRAGTTGDIVLPPQDMDVIAKLSERKDEIGQTIAACASFVTHINGVSKSLETIANGDLTAEFTPLSDRDTLGLSLKRMTASLNTMFSEINASTSQVSTGASQVADGAQALAAGATEQAASVQELSASIAEIAGRTKLNAEKAGQAAKLAGTIKNNAEKGSGQMDEMMNAVNDINRSNQDISKVIRVIDDIAFQTNILALNAAVEAARAGQHGKGFAVVAEEVRNLAAKSADAAKNTESLIASSKGKAEMGVRIAEETSASLSEIVSGINESNTLVAEIATSSEEQSVAITQINTGIDQVAQVVQQNSATAQQSAAASQEMSGQSAVLQQLVGQFKIKDGVPDYISLPPVKPEYKHSVSAPESEDGGFKFGGRNSGFGKY